MLLHQVVILILDDVLPEKVKEAMVAEIPLGRMADAKDLRQ